MPGTISEHFGRVDRFRWPQERPQAVLKRLIILDFTLPDHFDRPTRLLQFGLIPAISNPVLLNLWRPEFEIRFGKFSGLAFVTMPKAPMNEYRLPSTENRDVGTTGKLLPVKPETVAQTMEE